MRLPGSVTRSIRAAANTESAGICPDSASEALRLPPPDPNKLRLFHGSCRKPHGEAEDALAILDQLMASTAEKPNERPHQLLLTGDQIYADDVADSLLLLLTDAGETLLGWNGTLLVFPPPASWSRPRDLSPYAREKILAGVGFTSEDLLTHLMFLADIFP